MLKENILKSIDFKKMKCAFVIKNLKTQECAFYNENEVVPSASLIKVFIMAEILHQVNDGKLSLQQRIVVNKDVKVPFSILTMLEDGNSYSLADIITLMIVQSDNTAANILMDIAGMDNVNKFIKSMNFKNSILKRKMMDFNARVEGRENYTTASDMAQILELLYEGKVLDKESSAYMIDVMKKQLDTSMMMLNIPDETVVAHKTGELDFLDHEAGIVYQDKGDYIFCVLVWDAISNNYARQALGTISKVVYDYFKGEE
jgi:beta-lactamase class A